MCPWSAPCPLLAGAGGWLRSVWSLGSALPEGLSRVSPVLAAGPGQLPTRITPWGSGGLVWLSAALETGRWPPSALQTCVEGSIPSRMHGRHGWSRCPFSVTAEPCLSWGARPSAVWSQQSRRLLRGARGEEGSAWTAFGWVPSTTAALIWEALQQTEAGQTQKLRWGGLCAFTWDSWVGGR